MKTVLRFSLLGALLLGGHAFAAEPKKFDISMFPAAEVNQERVVIRLPEVENEADMMVELQVGKKMLVDCNLPRFAGNLEQHSVKGWGYNYLALGQVSGPVSTLMACPNGQKKETFIQIYGQGFFVNYNSKLPFVIYVPQEYEVRYRLWRADNLAQPAMIE
ncbi:serine protease inhibitor ecotin [Aeromonas veronii]|uniref:serine protease inhibitor ecotin n=1 Tax=Aeromonas veronii TaxID=654 RepID=UPI0032EC19F0